ncbi:hypothetical protein ABZ312_09365 [Streptomyces sp. NPDC006207]
MLVSTLYERQLAVAHWLLQAAERGIRRAVWEERGLIMLECGTLFSVVRIPAGFVEGAARSRQPEEIDGYLAEALDGGPVVVDRISERYYALVPGSTARRWDVAGTVCLGRNSCLGVPYPDRTQPRVGRPYWSVPMDSAGDLCVPGLVTRVIEAGRPRGALA